MIGHLTLHNLYMMEISEAANKVSAKLTSTEIDWNCAMTTGISKLATDEFT